MNMPIVETINCPACGGTMNTWCTRCLGPFPDPDTARSQQAEVERLREENRQNAITLDNYRTMCNHALRCVDRVFQVGGQPEAPLLPDFCGLGDDKFEAVVKLGEAYKQQQAENARLRARVGELEAENAKLKDDRESLRKSYNNALDMRPNLYGPGW